MSTTEKSPGPVAPEAQLGAGLERALVLLLATTCGTAVASLYYAQPLLHTLGRAFSVSAGTAGLIVTIGQLGFVGGLALLVPLGDVLERRGLIAATLLATAAGLVVCALAPGFAVFAAGTALVGVSCVAAQIVVPMASSLARPQERGQVVGDGDERAADRDPARADLQRADRLAGRLAGGSSGSARRCWSCSRWWCVGCSRAFHRRRS